MYVGLLPFITFLSSCIFVIIAIKPINCLPQQQQEQEQESQSPSALQRQQVQEHEHQSDIFFPNEEDDENEHRIYPILIREQISNKRHRNRNQNQNQQKETQATTNFDAVTIHNNQSREEETRNEESKVPIDFINQLNAYENLTDVLHNFVEEPLEDDDQQANPLLENRFSERNSYSVPKSAGCMPELQPVKIVNNTDPSIMYIPSCTRIERCGGCCSHPLLACKPTATETVSFQITKTQYTGGSKLKNLGKEIVLVEKHTKCRCDCKIQPEDCQPSQTYSKKECKCVCNNKDEQKKCIKNSSLKLWNSNSCQCQCRDFLQCSTGSRFDPNSCKCEVIPLRKRDRLIAEPRSSSLSTTFD